MERKLGGSSGGSSSRDGKMNQPDRTDAAGEAGRRGRVMCGCLCFALTESG